MSDAEPNLGQYLGKILSSISIVVLWMLINSTIGIGLNYAFFTNAPTLGNYIFYAWFLLSLALLILFLVRKWKP